MFRLDRAAVFRSALAQSNNEVLIEISNEQLSHAINDSMRNSARKSRRRLAWRYAGSLRVMCRSALPSLTCWPTE